MNAITKMVLFLWAFMAASGTAMAFQPEINDTVVVDSGVVVVTVPEEEWDFTMPVDSALEDSIQKLNEREFEKQEEHADTARISLQLDSIVALNTIKKRWIPNPKKAMWLALVIPGGGQIYNKKYWKLPIVYGGFVGCMYALHWNNTMYRDYSQAYIDLMDKDENTKSYENFLTYLYIKTRYTISTEHIKYHLLWVGLMCLNDIFLYFPLCTTTLAYTATLWQYRDNLPL
jgi:hypothetical protein